MNNNVLIVVDMQSLFDACRKNVAGVRDKIVKRIMQHNGFIIIVEFSGFGETCEEIMKATQGKCYVRVEKSHEDGSPWLRRIIDGMTKLPTNIDVCGVNTCQCVAATASGLQELFRSVKVRIVEDCVACFCHKRFDTHPEDQRKKCLSIQEAKREF